MAKIGSMDFRTLRGSTGAGAPMMGTAQFEAMLHASRVFMQVTEEINKNWLDAMQDAAMSGTDLATRLCRCGNPLEAVELCNHWLNERAEKLVAQSRQASDLCQQLYRSAAQSAEAAVGAVGREQDSAESKRNAQAA